MGEYYKGHKLGTCEHLMYITREEVEKFLEDRERKIYTRLSSNFIYRFPKDKSATILAEIDEREPFDYITLTVPPIMENGQPFEICHDTFAQVTMKSAFSGQEGVFNLDFCPADKSAYQNERGIMGQLNQWGITLQIVGNRYTEENPDGYTVFQCPWCRQWCSLDSDEIEHIKQRIKDTSYEYITEHLKARK